MNRTLAAAPREKSRGTAAPYWQRHLGISGGGTAGAGRHRCAAQSATRASPPPVPCGIPFLFDLPSWQAWWQTDSRWERRGREPDKLVMARHGDVGPYCPANVYCTTHGQNLADINPDRRREGIKRGIARFLNRVQFGSHSSAPSHAPLAKPYARPHTAGLRV